MISHVPGPTERLMRRLATRWELWLDSCFAVAAGAPSRPVSQPEPPRAAPDPRERGLPRVLQDLVQMGNPDLPQRKLAKTLGTSRATVQRAQRALRLQDIP